MVPIDQLKENPVNPNTHPFRQIEILAKIIKELGWRAPITVSNQSGFIVRGHGRLEAAKMLNLTEVPIDFQDYPNETAELADLVADNRVSDLSVWSEADLLPILNELSESGVEIENLGWKEEELEAMLAQMDTESPPEDPGQPEQPDDRFVRFQFGDYRGLVAREVYEKFVNHYKRIQLDTGQPMLTDILKELFHGDR